MSLVSLIFGVINLMHFVWNMHTHYRYTYISSCDKKRCITDLSKCKENCLLPINGEMCYTTLWPLCMVTWKQGAVYKKAKALWFFRVVFLPSKFFFYYLMFSLWEGGGKSGLALQKFAWTHMHRESVPNLSEGSAVSCSFSFWALQILPVFLGTLAEQN